GGLVIKRIVDAVDLLLDRLRHRRLDHFGIGPRIARVERDLRRHDFRELRDGDRENGDGPGKRDDDGDDDGEPRPLDENAGQHLARVSANWGGRGRQAGSAPSPAWGGGLGRGCPKMLFHVVCPLPVPPPQAGEGTMWHRRSYLAIHGSGLRNTLLRSRHDSCRHDLAGTNLLDALDDDLLSLLEAVGDHDVAALLGTGRYAALLDFLVRT